MLVQSKSLVDAAKRNGVNHIVHLGAFTTDQDSYATVFAWHQMIEAYLRSSGVAWTNLHPDMFMQNLLTYTSIRGGQYRPYTSKALGFTALEDLGEAAAVILMEGLEKHSGKDYFFSADALTPQQVTENLTAATGRKFTAAVLDAQTFLNETTQFNVRTSVFKGRIRILPLRRGRKNGLRWNRKRRYKENSRLRTIVAEGMGKSTRQ